MSTLATPAADQCELIIGPRGSGKSKLAELQIMATPHVIILDTKGDFEFQDPSPRYQISPATSIDELVQKLRFVEEQERGTHFYGAPVVLRPGFHAPTQRGMCDEAARIAMLRGGTRLYYDELAEAVNFTRYEMESPYFRAVLQQGRSKNVSATMSTQRPARIPLISGSESEFRVTFFVRHPSDQKAVEGLFGVQIPWQQLGKNKHSFVMVTDDTTTSDSAIEPQRLNLPNAIATQRSA